MQVQFLPGLLIASVAKQTKVPLSEGGIVGAIPTGGTFALANVVIYAHVRHGLGSWSFKPAKRVRVPPWVPNDLSGTSMSVVVFGYASIQDFASVMRVHGGRLRANRISVR